MKKFSDFYDAVRQGVKERLACYELSDVQLDSYLESELEEIKNGYEEYKSREDAEHLSDEACFLANVNSTAYCLEMCY